MLTHKSGNVALWGIFLVIVIGVLAAAVMYGNNQESAGDADILAADQRDEILAVRETDNIKGVSSAPVTIIEYSDFQCPACKSFAPVIESILEENEGDVAFVYRHLPLRQIHPNADLAGRAAEAAGNQGKFFEMHDLLFAEQENWSAERNPRNLFVEYAESLDLDSDVFTEDLNSPEVATRINEDYQEAELLLGGQRGLSTPTIFVNGERIQGQAMAQLSTIVSALVEASKDEEGTSADPEAVTPADTE